jgi:hypothetical protein
VKPGTIKVELGEMMVGFGVGVGVGAGCGTVRFDDILSPLILKLVISLRR